MSNATEHACDATIPVCTCGRRWDYLTRYSNGSVTYTSELVVQKYRAIYGEPERPFERVYHAIGGAR